MLCTSILLVPVAAAVYGGQEASATPPFLVSFFEGEDPVSGHVCGGALIAPTLVLTAAHCANDPSHAAAGLSPPGSPPAAARSIRIGPADLRSEADEIVPIASEHVHPRYLVGPSLAANDVAILVLERPVTRGATVRLAQPGDEALYLAGTESFLRGWGCGFDGCPTPRLREMVSPVWSDLDCKMRPEYVATFDPATQLCAGEPYVQGGGGDSGSPLVVYTVEGEAVAIGVTSWLASVHAYDVEPYRSTGIYGPGGYHPTVFAEISAQAEFIRAFTG